MMSTYNSSSTMIAIFTIFALINLSLAQEDMSQSRRLGFFKPCPTKCEKALDLTDRCCGDDLSACKCPVRECTKWYCGWIQNRWDYKCDYYESIASECTIPSVAQEAGVFTTLLAAVSAANLTDALSGEGPFTVFAPDDDAFAALGDVVPCLLEESNLPVLTDILLYHVVAGKILSTDLSDGQTATTLLEQDITVNFMGDGVMINDSTVTEADIMASNGVIHKIDSVLIPPVIDLSACVPSFGV